MNEAGLQANNQTFQNKMHKAFEDAFKQCDKDKDGHLNEEEFKQFYKLNLQNMKEEYGDAPEEDDEIRELEWNQFLKLSVNKTSIAKTDFNLIWKAWGEALKGHIPK